MERDDNTTNNCSAGIDQDPTRTNQGRLSFRQTVLRPDATVLVWGAWLALSAALILATVIFARPFPWLDDFAFLPFVTDKAPLRLEWLWQPHNEHRILIPKLFCWATLKLDGGNFIFAKYLYVVALSSCAALLLLSLRKARGYLLRTDVAIPLALLGFHNLFNTLWLFQAQFILATISTCLLLAIMVRNGPFLSAPSALLAGCCVISLPLCGANGLVVAIPLIIWLLFSALYCFLSRPAAIGAAAICIVSAVTAITVCSIYFVGLNHSVAGASLPWLKVCQDAIGLMAFGAGYAAKLNWRAAGLFAAFVVAGTALMLLFAAWKHRHDSYRAISLLVIIVALAGLAGVVAYGRDVSPFAPLGYLQDRYAMLFTPLSLACYIAVSLPPRNNPWAQGLRIVLACLLLLGLPYNISQGIQWGRKFDSLFDGMYTDVLAGRPAWTIAAKYQGFEGIHPWAVEFESSLLELKHRNALGMSRLNEAFPGKGYFIVPLSPYLTERIRCVWDPASGNGEVTGKAPGLRFDLNEPLKVAALRMKLNCLDLHGQPIFSTLTYLCTEDPRWDVRLLQNVRVSPYWPAMTKYMDGEISHVVLCIPYGTARFELTDLVAICRKR